MFRRKHKPLRSLRDLCPAWRVPVASGGQQVVVQQVFPRDPNTLQWNFSASVSAAPSNVPQLLASGDGSTYQAPTAVTTSNGGLAATYSGPVLSPGSVYSVTAPPVGVTFSAGTLSVPQVGAVISSEEAAALADAATPMSLKLTAIQTRHTKTKKPTRRAA